MHRRTILAKTASGLGLVSILSACSSDVLGSAVGAALNSGLVQAPQFEVQSFAVQSLSLNSQVLNVTTKITNPNPVQLVINSMNLSMQLAGIDLGQTTSTQPFTIPANNSVTVPLAFNVNLVNALSQSVGLLNVRLDTPLGYALVGQMNVSQLGLPVPVNIRGTVTPNQMIGMAQFLANATGGASGLIGAVLGRRI